MSRHARAAGLAVWCSALLTATATWGSAQAPALSGSERTPHFQLHFRPGSKAEASVDRIASLVEAELARILREVGLKKFDHTIDLYLYDDVADLQRTTGVAAAGYSVPLASHVPHDNDQTRLHELVHVVAEKFTERGPEPRGLFCAEGLANAVLGYVHGVHVDAVAAFHLRRGDLPAIGDVHAHQDFYAWLQQHPWVNGYDVAGSWMRFLLDRSGPAAVRRYYCGVDAKQAFGDDLASLEAAWHAKLGKVALRPGALSLLRSRHGRSAAERNPALADLEASGVLGPAAQWQAADPTALPPAAPARWSDGESPRLQLNGTASMGDWCVAPVAATATGDAIVRATFEPGDGCFGVQVQFGKGCQAMLLRGQGAFLYQDDQCRAHSGAVSLGDGPVTLVMRRVGTNVVLWLDGKLAIEGELAGDGAPFGVGCVGGPANVADVALRKL